MKKNDDNKLRRILVPANRMAAVTAMSNDDAGWILKAIFVYANENRIIDGLPQHLLPLVLVFTADIDDDRESYKETCKKNKENAEKGVAARKAKMEALQDELQQYHECSADRTETKVSRKRSVAVAGDGNQSHANTNNNDNNNTNAVCGENISLPTNKAEEESECDDSQLSFDNLWALYGKPNGNKARLREMWHAFPYDVKGKVMAYVPQYVRARPNARFRKNLENFFAERTWETEPIETITNNTNEYDAKHNTTVTSGSRRAELYNNATKAMQRIAFA